MSEASRLKKKQNQLSAVLVWQAKCDIDSLDAWRGKPLSPSQATKERKKAKASLQHILPNLLQSDSCKLTTRCSPVTSRSKLLQPFQDGRSAQTLQQWTTPLVAVPQLPSVLHFWTKKVSSKMAAHCNPRKLPVLKKKMHQPA